MVERQLHRAFCFRCCYTVEGLFCLLLLFNYYLHVHAWVHQPLYAMYACDGSDTSLIGAMLKKDLEVMATQLHNNDE